MTSINPDAANGAALQGNRLISWVLAIAIEWRAAGAVSLGTSRSAW
jgi:hypothetical protein